ncbi:olfactory receptor 10A7-like [Chelonia mydas]|uniref:olfactory receptor 10A7-like n=1 Tax=Chelonia mydas TaxID=8469 RepID=UPI001CA9B6A0|nr:olfactory receptor 10A7-like [Chelonia mydas]
MANTEGKNQTSITEFVLLGFRDLPELLVLLFLLFLAIYIVTLAGNILIVALVVADRHFHIPMYFFLGNLSCLETCYTSTLLPRVLASLSTEMLNLCCNGTNQIELVITILAAIFTLPPFVLTMMSYVCIIFTILRIPSTTGRQKAFSTCSSHLIVVTIFYGTLIIVYLLPKTNTLRDLNKVFSVCYTILTPMANPFIYSLRNKEVKEALRKIVSKCVDFTRN